MTDWRVRLRDADRARGDGVEPETAQRLRRTVLASASDATPVLPRWSSAFAATAATLVLLCAGLLTTLQGLNRAGRDAGSTTAQIDPAVVWAQDDGTAPERQQLHFSTPGGTRIIWVFDPGFEVKGTLP